MRTIVVISIFLVWSFQCCEGSKTEYDFTLNTYEGIVITSAPEDSYTNFTFYHCTFCLKHQGLTVDNVGFVATNQAPLIEHTASLTLQPTVAISSTFNTPYIETYIMMNLSPCIICEIQIRPDQASQWQALQSWTNQSNTIGSSFKFELTKFSGSSAQIRYYCKGICISTIMNQEAIIVRNLISITCSHTVIYLLQSKMATTLHYLGLLLDFLYVLEFFSLLSASMSDIEYTRKNS